MIKKKCDDKRKWAYPEFFFFDKAKKPVYSTKADYNTNSKSFYDYLAKFNHFIHVIVDLVNRLLRRDIEVKDTVTIDFVKEGNWIGEKSGPCEEYTDITTLSAHVIFSKLYTENRTSNFDGVVIVIPNGSKQVFDGVWSPDYWDFLDHQFGFIENKFEEIDNRLDKIEQDIENIYNEINRLDQRIEDLTEIVNNNQGGLQKIINNLYQSGAITTNNINNYEFVPGRNIASGTINLFAAADQGGYYIRTNNGSTQNDLIAGIGV